MSSIQEFLKDGSRHYQGTEEATLRNIEACKDLTQVVRTSLGPNGMNKMVINHLEKLFVTSDAATIIKELEVVHPAAKMVVMASKQQEQEVGDNTNLVVVFAGELLQQAESLIRMGLHISDIVFGYKKAGAKALELLETLVVSSLENLKDQSSVEKAIRSAVTSKQLEWETHLVPAIARACIETLPQNPSAFNVDSVRCCKITGGSVADTQFIHGFALVKDVNGTIRHVKNAKVVVFAGGIEAPKTESKGTVLLTTADELLNYSKGEESQMETIVKNIADSGANVVVSGGAISALALHYLERYKIMVLREGSKFQLRRICRATGATPLARVGKPLPEELGECEEVTVDEVGSTKVTFFRNSSERCQIATLLIRGPTQNTMDDVERAVDDAVNVYKALIRDPRLLAGAGASELELARVLMPFGDAAPGLDQYAIKKYAEALEVIPRILADNSGLDSSEIVSSLYAAHTQGKTTFGVNVEAAEIGDAVAINVFDAFVGKYWALKLATDAALTILQVDQIIMAKAADGPKVPQMGARDAD